MAARKNHRRRRKHAENQNAQNDVIGKMHGVVPAMPKVACTGAINVTGQRDRTPLPTALVESTITAASQSATPTWA
jgi:hypothetical protein